LYLLPVAPPRCSSGPGSCPRQPEHPTRATKNPAASFLQLSSRWDGGGKPIPQKQPYQIKHEVGGAPGSVLRGDFRGGPHGPGDSPGSGTRPRRGVLQPPRTPTPNPLPASAKTPPKPPNHPPTPLVRPPRSGTGEGAGGGGRKKNRVGGGGKKRGGVKRNRIKIKKKTPHPTKPPPPHHPPNTPHPPPPHQNTTHPPNHTSTPPNPHPTTHTPQHPTTPHTHPPQPSPNPPPPHPPHPTTRGPGLRSSAWAWFGWPRKKNKEELSAGTEVLGFQVGRGQKPP